MVYPGRYDSQGFGTVSDFWQPTAEDKVTSGRSGSIGRMNVWELDVAHLNLTEIFGLRIGGERAIRAKYPNGNPELTGPDAVAMLTYEGGWVTTDNNQHWIKPADKWNETKVRACVLACTYAYACILVRHRFACSVISCSKRCTHGPAAIPHPLSCPNVIAPSRPSYVTC